MKFTQRRRADLPPKRPVPKPPEIGEPTFVRAVLAWLRDFPRRTWIAHTEEGKFVVWDEAMAKQACSECEPGEESNDYVERGTWMQPSAADALPEM